MAAFPMLCSSSSLNTLPTRFMWAMMTSSLRPSSFLKVTSIPFSMAKK